ncbi:MAG: rRNA pseudouridine synthase [Myxococcales bacterium]|nr:rRNA pseudouridine synthase [Myxococcales bacterium]
MPAVTSPGSPRERLQKILAAAGVASRRAAEDLIRAGRVTVNGVVATLGESADPDRDAISFDGERIQREPLEYWIVHKPRGVLTTVSDPQGRSTVVDLVRDSTVRLFPVGRLDLLSEGLVLLTNDGPLAHSLLHPSFGEEREYRVTVRGSFDRSTQRRISEGVELEDGLTAPARVGAVRFDPQTRTTRFALTLVEGKKRQIRRMMRELGRPVVRLVRVRLGPLELGQLEPGKARPLGARERRVLRKALGGARGEEQAGGN